MSASNESGSARNMRGGDPREQPLSADALKGAAGAHEELSDVFGDEAETIERQDAQVLNFVHKRTPTSVAGKDQARQIAVCSRNEPTSWAQLDRLARELQASDGAAGSQTVV